MANVHLNDPTAPWNVAKLQTATFRSVFRMKSDGELRWSHIVGQFGGLFKVYSGV